MDRVTACALRGCRALSLRSPQAMARRRVRRSVRAESGPDQVGGAKQRQGHAVTPSLKQGLPAHALFCQFFDEVAQLGEDEFFHREAHGVF